MERITIDDYSGEFKFPYSVWYVLNPADFQQLLNPANVSEDDVKQMVADGKCTDYRYGRIVEEVPIKGSKRGTRFTIEVYEEEEIRNMRQGSQ